MPSPFDLAHALKTLQRLVDLAPQVAPEVSGGDGYHFTLGYNLCDDRNAASEAISLVEHCVAPSLAAIRAHIARLGGSVALPGKADELLQSGSFTSPLNGSKSVVVSGREIAELAADAERFTTAWEQSTKCITSHRGASIPTCDESYQTSCCSVVAAIAGFIPRNILASDGWSIELVTSAGWTNVPDENGKPASDAARYKACGNGVVSNVAEWIASRLLAVEEAA